MNAPINIIPLSGKGGDFDFLKSQINSFQNYVIVTATTFRHFEWGHWK